MTELLNCPNCGAPIHGSKCEYCGTVFEKPEAEELVMSNLSEPTDTVIRISSDGIEIFKRRADDEES